MHVCLYILETYFICRILKMLHTYITIVLYICCTICAGFKDEKNDKIVIAVIVKLKKGSIPFRVTHSNSDNVFNFLTKNVHR